MNLRREATKTIWKTVVFAGAMLGTAACGGKSKPAATMPENTDDTAKTGDPCAANPCATQPDPCAEPDPCADPCGRPRGVSDEGDVGRGFLLS